MASKHGIAVGGGVKDADYTGDIKVILQNQRNTSYKTKAGDHITELIVEKSRNTQCHRNRESG